MKWMTIESAPHDGTRVQVGNPWGVWHAEYREFYQSGMRAPNPWQSMMLNHRHMPDAKGWNPTHWMPLPEPPSTEGGEDG